MGSRIRLIAKATAAAVASWLLAVFLLDHPQPYFAPLAALLGTYPTVVRSLREGTLYALGFAIGAGIAVPVALLLGPSVWGLLVTVPVTLTIAAWPALGGQGLQVPFTALFVLLAGGDSPIDYTLPRMADVAVGVAAGLLVNVVWPPDVRISPETRAARRLGADTAELLRAAADDTEQGRAEEGGRSAGRAGDVTHGLRELVERQSESDESFRLNPKARIGPRSRRLHAPRRSTNALYCVAEQARTVERAVRRNVLDAGEAMPGEEFRADYAELLRRLAVLVEDAADLDGEEPTAGVLAEVRDRCAALRDRSRAGDEGGNGDAGPGEKSLRVRMGEAQLCAVALELLREIASVRGVEVRARPRLPRPRDGRDAPSREAGDAPSDGARSR